MEAHDIYNTNWCLRITSAEHINKLKPALVKIDPTVEGFFGIKPDSRFNLGTMYVRCDITVNNEPCLRITSIEPHEAYTRISQEEEEILFLSRRDNLEVSCNLCIIDKLQAYDYNKEALFAIQNSIHVLESSIIKEVREYISAYAASIEVELNVDVELKHGIRIKCCTTGEAIAMTSKDEKNIKKQIRRFVRSLASKSHPKAI